MPQIFCISSFSEIIEFIVETDKFKRIVTSTLFSNEFFSIFSIITLSCKLHICLTMLGITKNLNSKQRSLIKATT